MISVGKLCQYFNYPSVPVIERR